MTQSSSASRNRKRGIAKKAEAKEEQLTKRTRQCDCEHHNEQLEEEEDSTTFDEATNLEKDKEFDQKIVFVDRPSDLKKIQSESVELAVWRSSETATNQQDYSTSLLDPSITASELPTFEGVVTTDDAAMIMRSYLCPPYKLRSKAKSKINNYDDTIGALIDEIDQLVRVFGDVSQSDLVHVKLHVIQDNGCAYWHQDCVEYRLVKTYRGPCTEFVTPAYSERTLRRHQFNSKHAQSFTHRDVALFKGRGETTEDDDFLNQPGIVHRSPRVEEGSGIFRLVLVLDIPKEGWHY